MINGYNKKAERGANPAIVADVAAEAQRIAAALARAEARVPDKLQLSVPDKVQLIVPDKVRSKPKAALHPASAKPAIPAEKFERSLAEENMGFDPYNSGSFDRKHAWSKIGKR